MFLRLQINGAKAGLLFMITATAMFALEASGIHDLSSPWLVLVLTPVAVLYVLEIAGKVVWFKGITLPTLLLLTATIALLWVLNAKEPIKPALAYGFVSIYCLANAFLLVRMMIVSGSRGN